MSTLEEVIHTGDPDLILPHFYDMAASVWWRSFRELEKQDALQEAVFYAWQSLGKFDPERGEAALYFYFAMKMTMQGMRQRAGRLKRQGKTYVLSHAEDYESAAPSPERYAMAREEWAIVERKAAELSPRHKDVLRRRLEKETLQSISDDYGLSRERIRQIEMQAKEAVR